MKIPAIPSVQEADLSFSGLEGVARSNPEQLDIEQLSGKRQLQQSEGGLLLAILPLGSHHVAR